MLNIVTGRSGSGKSTYVNQILYDLAQSGNNKLLLIVPEQFSFASERNILSSLPVMSAQNIEVLSFTRLADYVGRSFGGIAGTYADKGAEIIIMLRALEGLSDNLTFYGSHIKSVALAKELISTINELKRERITPDMLMDASERTNLATLRSKLYELSLIYSAYDSLFENKFISTSTLADKLLKTLSENDFFKGYTIAIDAFKGFTASELQILSHLIRQADEVYLTLCTEDIYKSDASMIWDAINDTAKKVIRLAKDNGSQVKLISAETKAGTRFESHALAYLEQNLFSPAPKSWNPEVTDGKTDITLYAASDRKNECSFIAATARKLIREDGLRLRDMAVIVRNESDYRRELKNAFVRFGIPVFEDARQPIMNQPLTNLCKAIFTILTGGFTTDNILKYLKTGLSPLDDLSIAELENYALMWSLTAKSWQDDFTLNPDGMNGRSSENSAEKLIELNEMRQKVILPLQKLRQVLKREGLTALDISAALYNFITNTGVKERLKELAVKLNEDGYRSLAVIQNRVYEILIDCINKLATIYGDMPTDITTYYNLFYALISVTDLGTIPHGLDEITIGSADRIRLKDPKVVFVAGCVDGVFPPVASTFGLLSTADRKNLSDLGIELSLSNSLIASSERFIAYTAVTSPTSKLYVSYYCAGELSEKSEPSCIYTNIKNLFEKGGISLKSFKDLPPDYFAETSASAFGSFAADFMSGSNEVLGIEKALQEIDDYKDRISALKKAGDKPVFEIDDSSIATNLFGEKMYLSASKVDVYHKCPFEYYCKYGINAKPREKAELDPRLSGTVIHYVLENIIRDIGKDRLIAMTENERNNEVFKWLSTYAENEIGGLDDKTLRFKYLYNRLARVLCHVVDRLCDEFANTDFVPCDFELAIGRDAPIKSYTLSLDDGGELSISGSIDRVDKYEKDDKTYIRIVDYKSGGKDFVLSDVLDGLNMQMLIYLFAIWSGGQEKYGDITPAGILYYPAKREKIDMSHKNMDQESITKAMYEKSRSNGLFLVNEDILEAMEHGQTGRFIKITDGRGNRLDNLVTLEEMAMLKNKTDDILRQMAQDLHQGHIPARPVHGKDYQSICEHCDYAIVCRSADEDYREIKKRSKEEIFSELSGGENNE